MNPAFTTATAGHSNSFEVIFDGYTVLIKTFDDVCVCRFNLDEIASIRRLRESHSALLAAAKEAFCMIDRKYQRTPLYEAVLAAIDKAEQLP